MAASPELHLSIQVALQATSLPVDRAQLRRWVRAALEQPAHLTLRFVDLPEGRRLNRSFRRKPDATNVLTFTYPQDPAGGPAAPPAQPAVSADVVICLPVVRREARAQRKPLRDHLAHLVIHGVLHAQGYDHIASRDAQRMQARETELLQRFRIGDPYVR